MRVIFMGTPDFSVGTLEALIEAGHEIVLAVTQPDKPRGRGKEMQYSPVKEAALAARYSGISATADSRCRMCGRIKEISCRCDGSYCIWTDFTKRDPGYDKVWLY